MNKQTIKQQRRRIIESALDERGLYINENEYNEKISQVFLGTVFNIMPSGKYYMPFACSNVESCARCKGEGCDFCGHTGSREAYEDELMIDSLEYYAQKTGDGLRPYLRVRGRRRR